MQCLTILCNTNRYYREIQYIPSSSRQGRLSGYLNSRNKVTILNKLSIIKKIPCQGTVLEFANVQGFKVQGSEVQGSGLVKVDKRKQP